MTSVKIKANGISLTVSVDGKITTGMVGIPVSVEFDSVWDGLVTKVLFRVGDRVRVMTDNCVPWELLRTSGATLEVGCEGRNEDGTLIIPTVWSTVSRIAEGASGDIPAAPTPGTSTGGGTGGSSTLIVTITDDVASHTSAEIYAHVQAGGTAVLDIGGGEYLTLSRFGDASASFSWLSGEENILTHYDVYEDGSVDAYVQQELASGEYVRGYTYSKDEINSLIDAKLGTTFTEIDTLLGGES